jgi:selenide,water dikinase
MSVKLTQYSHGAGCGCKIAPAVLDKILHNSRSQSHFPQLLVGNSSNDDAAVYAINDEDCLISTTDFFMPIVDDPFTFGKIAAVNAISDVYAMGGNPTMAIALLGWPMDKLEPEIAGLVLDGGKAACAEAGIPLAGGHSIDCPEPIFGLAVTGMVKKNHLKQNNTAQTADLLYLTKPLGVGIITTAQKKGIVLEEDVQLAIHSMTTLNKIGSVLGAIREVHALTDVTGFGLLGHAMEMAKGSNLTAFIEKDRVPALPCAQEYLEKKAIPGGTQRNWKSYGHEIQLTNENDYLLLADPQTSGGLLVAVDPSFQTQFELMMAQNGLSIAPIGKMVEKSNYTVIIQ